MEPGRPSRRSRPTRSPAVFAPLAIALLLSLGASWWGVSKLRISDVWPLELSKPVGWLVDRQLAELRTAPDLCRKVLASPQIVARTVADKSDRDGCGWNNAWKVTTAGSARLEVGAVSCELAAALALWVEHVVQPASRRHLGQSVAAVEHMGAYACRNMRGNPALAGEPSQHATANALDVKSFVLSGGMRIAVRQSWGRDAAEGRFLADIQNGACRYFRVAIGPAYNLAHRDHFHLDRGPWRACR